ncbi:unnamed protein product, partial [Medioppia subpectinata]
CIQSGRSSAYALLSLLSLPTSAGDHMFVFVFVLSSLNLSLILCAKDMNITINKSFMSCNQIEANYSYYSGYDSVHHLYAIQSIPPSATTRPPRRQPYITTQSLPVDTCPTPTLTQSGIVCMRFNRSLRRPQHVLLVDSHTSQPNHFQWTLVPHQHSPNQESTFIRVHSQDDQTLCFSWILDTHQASVDQSLDLNAGIGSGDRHAIQCIPELHSPKDGEDDDIQDEDISIDENRGYLLITLRRRKSIQRSIHIDPIALLDHSYYGITSRYLKQSSKWRFNTFTLDVLTGGFLESGYHDTNPYHNSVHAADVTQAMHCFIQEPKIRQFLTPLEVMCALLAAVSHDLDHPGVNQHFLIATKSHLAALYKYRIII